MATANDRATRGPQSPCPAPMIGGSDAMRRLRARIQAVARFDEPVLVIGETGTGKELAARALHAQSRRAARPLHVFNCAGLGVDVLASELFGHRRGGFTGASRDRRGRIRAADGSTLVLDEISEAPAALQSALLRALEEGEVQPVGDDGVVQVDVRFIATSNRALEELMGGVFRRDLFHRLAALVIEIPPLRERGDDVDELADHFLAQLNERYDRAYALTSGARMLLHEHRFPGNVRELRQVILRAYARSRDPEIAAEDIERGLIRDDAPAVERQDPSCGLALAQVIRRHIRHAIARADGNLSQAARLLEIPRSTLQHYLVKYSIDARERPGRTERAAR